MGPNPFFDERTINFVAMTNGPGSVHQYKG